MESYVGTGEQQGAGIEGKKYPPQTDRQNEAVMMDDENFRRSDEMRPEEGDGGKAPFCGFEN